MWLEGYDLDLPRPCLKHGVVDHGCHLTVSNQLHIASTAFLVYYIKHLVRRSGVLQRAAQ